MGCWGITAFESDAGLDAVGFIRRNLPENGEMQLGKIIEALKKDKWSCPPSVTDGEAHTSPMALAEIVVKLLDRDIGSLDYDEEWAAKDNKFRDLTSFTADKESVQWLREYISDTLKQAIKNAVFRAQNGIQENDQRNGWHTNENWLGWQKHMTELVDRMDTLLAFEEDQIELIQPQEQTMQM